MPRQAVAAGLEHKLAPLHQRRKRAAGQGLLRATSVTGVTFSSQAANISSEIQQGFSEHRQQEKVKSRGAESEFATGGDERRGAEGSIGSVGPDLAATGARSPPCRRAPRAPRWGTPGRAAVPCRRL